MSRVCLLTNDDGPGALLDATIEIVTPLVDQLITVVPSRNQSGVSSAVTFGKEFRVFQEREHGPWLVDAYPSDGVRYALRHLVMSAPDLLVSGVNNGYNLGRCVVNSGTIGAAFEGARLGVSAVCMSTERHLSPTASWCRVVGDVLGRCIGVLNDLRDHGPLVLSLNIPREPTGKVDCLPVSQVEFHEVYDVASRSAQDLLVSVSGEQMIADAAVPDIAALDRGTIVLNVLSTPWTVDVFRAVESVVRRV